MSNVPAIAVDGQLWYPRLDSEPSTISVRLFDVRAADDLVIGYDFDRDGWTIARDSAPDVEVAFIKSWGEHESAPNPDDPWEVPDE